MAYLGVFSQYTGIGEESLELEPDLDLGALIDRLCTRHGRPFTEALQADLDYRSALVAVNGELVSPDHPLRPGDEVVISYPAGGG